MNKSYLSIVFTLICLCGFGISARAQDVDKTDANVPFDFVAGGKTLPAGTYSVSRVSSEEDRVLVIRSYDNRVLLLPVSVEGVSADHTELSFEHIGGKYFLSKVDTLSGIYAFRVPPARTQVAKVKDRGTRSSSGAN